MPFRLTSLHEVDAPSGCEGVWQRYVITQGENTIVGMRCGVHTEVATLVGELVQRLNFRFTKAPAAPRSGARGRPAKSKLTAKPAPVAAPVVLS